MRTPVLIATLALGCAAATPAEAHKPSTPEAPAPVARPAPPAPKADRKAAPWNGGKARPPFTLRTTTQGGVKAEAPLTLVATVLPEQPCTSLSTRVRGTEGVVVRGTEKQHPTCEPGQPAVHEVTVTVPPGISGHAVVDVRMEVQGRVYESSQSIPLHAEGVSPASKPQQGTVERDENGGKVIILRPSKKEQ